MTSINRRSFARELRVSASAVFSLRGRNLAAKVNAAQPARPPHESKAAQETLVSQRLIKQVYASMQTESH